MTEVQHVDPREIDHWVRFDDEDTPRNNLTTYLDHLNDAERLAESEAEKWVDDRERCRLIIALAQVHATCAQAAATAWLAEQAGR